MNPRGGLGRSMGSRQFVHAIDESLRQAARLVHIAQGKTVTSHFHLSLLGRCRLGCGQFGLEYGRLPGQAGTARHRQQRRKADDPHPGLRKEFVRVHGRSSFPSSAWVQGCGSGRSSGTRSQADWHAGASCGAKVFIDPLGSHRLGMDAEILDQFLAGSGGLRRCAEHVGPNQDDQLVARADAFLTAEEEPNDGQLAQYRNFGTAVRNFLAN